MKVVLVYSGRLDTAITLCAESFIRLNAVRLPTLGGTRVPEGE